MNAPANSNQDANSPQGDDADVKAGNEFEQLADSPDPGIVREFLEFLRDNKKWWLAPILIVTLLLVGLVFLTASPAAPFIYTLF